jgi:hypothetical protein
MGKTLAVSKNSKGLSLSDFHFFCGSLWHLVPFIDARNLKIFEGLLLILTLIHPVHKGVLTIPDFNVIIGIYQFLIR